MSNHFISLAQAEAMTTLYHSHQEDILIPDMRGKDILLTSETFAREAFDVLLAEEGAAGIRIYIGMDANLWTRIIAVAIDQNGNDILPLPGNTKLADAPGNIVEAGQRCPTNCPGGMRLAGG